MSGHAADVAKATLLTDAVEKGFSERMPSNIDSRPGANAQA
jgi:hypothetical protein